MRRCGVAVRPGLCKVGGRIGYGAGLSLLLVAAAHGERAPFTTDDLSRRAFTQPMAGLSAEARQRFYQGRGLFDQIWVVAPSRNPDTDGLGPLYNRLSCVACHPANGRGKAPERPGDEMRSMLVRLSIAGEGPHGGPNPHPTYGDQLNEQGVPGVAGEGRAVLSWQQRPLPLADGSEVLLRIPHLQLTEPGYGDFTGILTSPRIAPAIYGLGLLEAVPEATLLAAADPSDANGDGISGRANWVWDAAAGRQAMGRFGLKANVATVEQQIAGAFIGDLGITSPLHPAENCGDGQVACRHTPSGGTPELTAAQLQAITFYHLALAVPARRNTELPQVVAGERLFQQAGCTACHTPQLTTGDYPVFPRLAGRTIAPYTDLLLHDMGEPLADGRPDYAANGREWRTPPLWGIGLAETVGDEVGYLHDGRARTLLEAVLWHWGEGAASREAVRRMDATERAALIAFLKSL